MSTGTGRGRLIVAGHGMVAQRFLEELVARGGLSRWNVQVLCEEPRPAYDRVALSSFFAGATAEDLSVTPAGFFAEHGIDLCLNEGAAEIDRERQLVTTTDGRDLVYDALVLATGSYPFVPPIPGADAEGAFVYRTIDDLEAIAAHAEGKRVGAVVGGGLLGLEAANALRSLGLETHVVEYAPRLMPVQLDDDGAATLRSRIEDLGVFVHTTTETSKLVRTGGAVSAMAFADGTRLDVDLVVFSAGIRPRDQLARDAGLEIGERGGVAVDERCRATNDPHVYAIGECAHVAGRTWGLVAPGYQMAAVAADALTGGEAQATFTGGDLSTKLKLLGVDVASFGDAFATGGDTETIVFHDPRSRVYKKLVVGRDDGAVKGGILVGDAAAYQTLVQMARGAMPTPPDPEALLFPASAGEVTVGVGAITPEATICSCNNVSKASVCAAVSEGACDAAGVKAATRAGSTCGGCVPLVTELVKLELAAAGREVRNDLCEHFAYSRQELFDLVRVHRIGSFNELLREHGRGGRGCEICKPAVASMFASLGGGYILDGEKAALQDTNDHFLANLQRDGTYSVVPRVPGGEITPEQLIAIGEVARDFGLYTKITGGQRIDLFGATVDQLPAIWERLIAAGMESGHAYGKALRRVKSCVGQTWCRFGVQDSTALAIKLELRYRGLRAPHKLKSAVSGCTRECAEAQSKDFGIIATERGWNLYVGGNGGMRPQHAVLLAEDLDEETLIRYVDRYLMFYVRTADRLERTATWLNKLDGGIDYLRRVVIDDALGIADELEADMQHHVDSYACEWKETVEDPARRARFRSFLNEDIPDPNVVFVPERGQRRPATPSEKPIPVEALR
jgi:nitrite reductase (NADH) large subunit